MTNGSDTPDTLRMPDPPTLLERVQAQLDAAGIPRDLMQVTGIGPDDDGAPMLKMSMEPGIAEELIKLLSIRLHTGTQRDDRLPRVTGVRPETPAAEWTAEERRKQTKPKGKLDLPGH